MEPKSDKSFKLIFLRWMKTLISIAISFGILIGICVYKKIRFDGLAGAWSEIDKTVLVFTIVFSALFHIFVGAHKLWKIMCAMGVDMSYGESLLVRLGAGPLRFIVPLKTGTVVNILYFYRHKQMPLGRSSGAVVFDKGLNLIGMTYWLLFGLILLPNFGSTPRRLFVAGAGVFFVLLFFCGPIHELAIRISQRMHSKAGDLAEGVLSPFREFSVKKKLYFLFYGLFFTARPLLVCLFLFKAYDVHIKMTDIVARAMFAMFAGHVPGTLLGMGPRELVVSEMFSGFTSKEIALSVGILMTLTIHVIPILLGIPWVPWFLKRLALNRNEIAESGQ